MELKIKISSNHKECPLLVSANKKINLSKISFIFLGNLTFLLNVAVNHDAFKKMFDEECRKIVQETQDKFIELGGDNEDQ